MENLGEEQIQVLSDIGIVAVIVSFHVVNVFQALLSNDDDLADAFFLQNMSENIASAATMSSIVDRDDPHSRLVDKHWFHHSFLRWVKSDPDTEFSYETLNWDFVVILA